MKILSRKGLFSFLFLTFLFSNQILAKDLLIVEVQIAGEKSSDDYIKIYNPSDFDVYLNNYQGNYLRLVKRTKTGNKDYTIKSWSKEEEKVPAKSFYLWSNKNYQSLPANCLTSQTISPNNGIALRLGPENTGKIIDAVGWGDFNNLLFEEKSFPENPAPNQKLKRKKINESYQDSNNNSDDFYLDPPSKEKTKESLPGNLTTEEDFQKIKNSDLKEDIQVFINEILANTALGERDEEKEYIEIFNPNHFEVNLSGWKIEDVYGKSTNFIIPPETKISPREFLVFYRSKTKIILNNDQDAINLINPEGEIIDTVYYEKAPSGLSFNKTPSGWKWSEFLTPGKENVFLIQKSNDIKEEKEFKKIDINTAPLEDLVKIVHIGETKAKELISLRPFYSLEDLLKIKGIGKKSLEDIKKQGLAWVDPKLTPPKKENQNNSLEKKIASPSENIKPLKASLFEQSFKKEKNSFFLFLIALTIAISSSIGILILKKKITKEKI